ncbi:MAG: murein L,D-transpeptidase catalytic domain family protein [Ferruginibacter sp.]
MLKTISYHLLVLATLMIMGHTSSSSDKIVPVFTKPSTIAVNYTTDKSTAIIGEATADCYNLWQLGNAGLSKNAFDYAMKGFRYLSKANMVAKKNIVSIVDFSRPSTQKRLYVINLATGKILFNTWVAHGRNSGNEYATQFSNLPESHQSSLGFYVTMDTYVGGNGYSLRLKGCEKGINDKAYERAIVIHGADYVSNNFINSRGELGRSYGCPAIPTELSKKIIDVIKNGSCLFLYHPTKKYCSQSKILNRKV